jgi:hypothetical protein
MRKALSFAGFILLAALVFLQLPAIGRPTRAAPVQRTFADGVRELRRIALEERDGHLLVRPRARFDPAGGFLVADARERQIRHYSAAGALLAAAGRQGQGPGEFRHPVGVQRLGDGRVIAIDMTGRLTVFDAELRHVIETQPLPFTPVYDLAVVNDSVIAVAGKLTADTGTASTRLAHTWNIRAHRRVASFGRAPEHTEAFESAFTFAGSTALAVRGGQVAVVHALGDEIQVFDLDGTPAKPIHIPWEQHRPLREPLAPDADDAATERWLSTFSAAASLHWLRDGRFVVQYLDVDGPVGKWSLVGVSPRGARLFEYGSPQLLSVSPLDGRLLFIDPDSELPNRWIIGNFSR